MRALIPAPSQIEKACRLGTLPHIWCHVFVMEEIAERCLRSLINKQSR
ncbi:MAG: hypothetical protein ACFB0D_17365 [Phormidesmis sp.]